MSEPLEQIKGRIRDCATYNFGMRSADKLAHEDAPKLVEAIEAIDFALSRYEASGIFLRPAADIRHALNEALGSKA